MKGKHCLEGEIARDINDKVIDIRKIKIQKW